MLVAPLLLVLSSYSYISCLDIYKKIQKLENEMEELGCLDSDKSFDSPRCKLLTKQLSRYYQFEEKYCGTKEPETPDC